MTRRAEAGANGASTRAGKPGRPGVVLRDVQVHGERRALVRPGGARPPLADGATAETPERTAAARPSSYDEGVRVGVAQAEEAQRDAVAAALEAARAEGRERGLAEGREAGRAEALDTARQQADRDREAARVALAERTAALDAVIRAWEGERATLLAAAEDDLVALSHAVVCRILGEQLINAEGVARFVRQAIREQAGASGLDGGDQRALAIHLHPRDLERLQRDEHVAAWVRRTGSTGGGRLQWVADERVGAGGCIIRSAEGSLDARLETQLVALRHLLTQVRSTVPSARAGAAMAPPGSEGKR